MKDYIKYIREKVGHDEIMAVGVACLVINENDELLLETRSDNGFLCFPGGALDMGEKVEDGIRREVLEETGIKIDNLKLIGVYSGLDSRLRYPNGDVTYYTDIVFLSKVRSDVKIAPLDKESTLIKFYKINEIDLNKLLLMDKKVIENYIKNKDEFIID